MSKDFLAKQFSKEHIYVVEIDVPRCVNTHGVSPCQATETGDAKCYNTRSTCNDLANYNDEIAADGAISVNATSGQFVKSAGTSFITEGFKVGDYITTSGFTNDGNNRQFKISAVTSTAITVTSNYKMVTESAGTRTLTKKNIFTYKHCTNRAPHPQNMNNYVPCVDSVDVAPAVVNPKGGIGARSSATVQFSDIPGSDRYGIDPYLDDRNFDPFETGLYWIKWRARNANYENYAVRVKSGYIVNNRFNENNFETREYVIASMTANGGKAGIKLKDPMQLISNKKSLAPQPSTGELATAITATATTATLTPSGVGNDEYPASGQVKIRDEVISFTRSNDALTLTRGQFNTTATAHDLGDTVQLCLNYDGTRPMDEVQYNLFVNYAKIPAYYINGNQWMVEVDTFLPSNPKRLITDPTPVEKLSGELSQQWPHKLFWNDRESLVQLTAIKAPPTGSLNILDEDSNIMELSTGDKNDLQISTIFVRYAQFDPTKKVDENDNYQVTFVRVNQDAIARYDSNNTMTIYAPWISAENGAQARAVAQLYGRRFGITPREINFMLEDKDSSRWVGDVIGIRHFDICDANGRPETTPFEIVSAKESSQFSYKALEFNFDALLAVDDELDIETVDLALDELNVNLLDKYTEVFGAPDASTDVKFIVSSGVVIGSADNSTASMVTGTWPSGATITLQLNTGSFVVGYGGNGGNAPPATPQTEDGGPALSLQYNLTLINNGILGGGGGGGGPGTDLGGDAVAAGGGGAGSTIGLGGSGTNVNQPDPFAQVIEIDAQDGTTTTGGDGGTASFSGNESGAAFGGDGGDLGQPGGDASGGLGGAAGKAIDLNGNTLTKTVAGDIRGLES